MARLFSKADVQETAGELASFAACCTRESASPLSFRPASVTSAITASRAPVRRGKVSLEHLRQAWARRRRGLRHRAR